MKANKRKLLSILAISFVIALSLSFVGIGLQGKEVYANSGSTLWHGRRIRLFLTVI